jgi:sulfonate transport system substrate-binding protein
LNSTEHLLTGRVSTTFAAGRTPPKDHSSGTLVAKLKAALSEGKQMRLFQTVLLGILAISAVCSTSRAEPVKIRVAWVVPAASWGSILLQKKELARHLGQSYVLEPVAFNGSPPQIAALASGELEIADLAFSTLPIAIENAGLDDLRVIAGGFQDGLPGFYSQEFMVLADGPIKTVEDLKGKVVATVGAGAAVDVGMRGMLRRYDLEKDRDYTMVETQFSNMRTMLLEKKADLIPVVLPYAFDPGLRRIARPLFHQSDTSGQTQLLVWTARKRFIDANRAAMIDFMEDALRITRWFLDPANHNEVMDIVARMTMLPPERYDWLFTQRDYYRDPSMLPDLEALQKNVDLVKDLGFVKDDLDVGRYTDLTLIEEAAARPK